MNDTSQGGRRGGRGGRRAWLPSGKGGGGGEASFPSIPLPEHRGIWFEKRLKVHLGLEGPWCFPEDLGQRVQRCLCGWQQASVEPGRDPSARLVSLGQALLNPRMGRSLLPPHLERWLAGIGCLLVLSFLNSRPPAMADNCFIIESARATKPDLTDSSHL